MESAVATLPTKRQCSYTKSNQRDTNTCFIHVSTRILSRLIKIKSHEFFEFENERINDYYDVECLKNIFLCFQRLKEQSSTYLPDELDENGWHKENISALLFAYIYNYIVQNYRRFGYDGLELECAKMFLDHFTSQLITIDIIKEKLDFECLIEEKDETGQPLLTRDTIDYCLSLMDKLKDIFENLANKYIHGTFTPLIFDRDKKSDGEHIYFNLSNTRLDISEIFIEALKKGYYGAFECINPDIKPTIVTSSFGTTETSYGHVVTVIGYKENTTGSYGGEKFIIKNSWGPCSRDVPFMRIKGGIEGDVVEDISKLQEEGCSYFCILPKEDIERVDNIKSATKYGFSSSDSDDSDNSIEIEFVKDDDSVAWEDGGGKKSKSKKFKKKSKKSKKSKSKNKSKNKSKKSKNKSKKSKSKNKSKKSK